MADPCGQPERAAGQRRTRATGVDPHPEPGARRGRAHRHRAAARTFGHHVTTRLVAQPRAVARRGPGGPVHRGGGAGAVARAAGRVGPAWRRGGRTATPIAGHSRRALRGRAQRRPGQAGRSGHLRHPAQPLEPAACRRLPGSGRPLAAALGPATGRGAALAGRTLARAAVAVGGERERGERGACAGDQPGAAGRRAQRTRPHRSGAVPWTADPEADLKRPKKKPARAPAFYGAVRA